MKPFVHILIISLIITSSIKSVKASGISGNGKSPHLTTSVAIPRNSRAPFPKYQFGLHIAGYALKQLSIEIPKQVKVSRITVRDQSGKKVEVNTTYKGNKAILFFEQTVELGETLRITLHSVRTATLINRVWLFPLTAQGPDLSTEISLGMARIHTYD